MSDDAAGAPEGRAELSGDKLGAAGGAAPAEALVAEDPGVEAAQPESTEQVEGAETGSVVAAEFGATEQVVEGAAAGADDEELEEVESDDADSDTVSSARTEGYESSLAGSAVPVPSLPSASAPLSGVTVAQLFARHKVLWILAAFVAGCVLMTLHILLPSPTAGARSTPDSAAPAKEAETVAADPGPSPSTEVVFDADEAAAEATAADLTTP
jgi:hypothetical protein